MLTEANGSSFVKTLTHFSTLLILLAAAKLAGCSSVTKTPDVSNEIRKALDQANLKTVSIDQDRDKGVMTLCGHVAAEAGKKNAKGMARSIADGQVVADQIAVLPLVR
jgi:hypothetical protein